MVEIFTIPIEYSTEFTLLLKAQFKDKLVVQKSDKYIQNNVFVYDMHLTIYNYNTKAVLKKVTQIIKQLDIEYIRSVNSGINIG